MASENSLSLSHTQNSKARRTFRFSFHPFTGVEFNIDFDEAGMVIYSGPYDELDSDRWDSIMDTIEDGEDDIFKQRKPPVNAGSCGDFRAFDEGAFIHKCGGDNHFTGGRSE